MKKLLLGILACFGAAGTMGAVPAVAQSELGVSQTASASVIAGNNLTYTVTLTNNGPNDAANLVMRDVLPAGTTFVSATQMHGPPLTLSKPAIGQNGTVTGTIPSFPMPITVASPSNLNAAGNTLFFMSGPEFWKSDGTIAGTGLLKTGLIMRDAKAVGNTLFFRGDSAGDSELWKSDGTEAGTVMVKNIAATGSSSPFNLAVVGDVLYFSADDGIHGRELWKSDGTEAGTVLVKDIEPGALGSSPSQLGGLNGTLFFAYYDGAHGTELWKSDGTAAGTMLFADIAPGPASSNPSYLTAVGNTLFFNANGVLWKTNGVGVSQVQYAANVNQLTAVGNTLFFSAFDNNNGQELWKSDGTDTGTVLVKNIRLGSTSSSLANLTAVGNTLFFKADDGNSGEELWKSDGTAAGTVQVKDIVAGSSGSAPSYFANLNGTLFFQAIETFASSALWKSDGTAAGTVLARSPLRTSFSIVVKVLPETTGTLSNALTVTSLSSDNNPNNNSTTLIIPVLNGPTALALSPSAVKEKLPSGTFVGTFSTADLSAGDSFSYSLVTGAGDSDNSQFSLVGTALRTAASFDASVKESYNIRVRTTDSTGLSFEQPFTITITENTKPLVSINSPTLNQKIAVGTFTGSILSGSATDNKDVVTVKVRLSRKRGTSNQYWNGSDFVADQYWLGATVNTVGESTVTWTLEGQLPPADKLDSGVYALQVYALDGANNKSDYANSTFSVSQDSIAPILILTAPTTNAKVLMGDFIAGAAQGTVRDDQSVAAVKVRLSRKSGTTTLYWNGADFVATQALVDADLTGTTNATWKLLSQVPPTEKLATGAYTIAAYALDGAGNKSATISSSFTLNTDYSAPTVSIATPTASKVIKINEFGAGVITGTAVDNIGITAVKLKLQRKRGTTYSYWNGTSFGETATLFDATYNSESGTWSYDSAIPASALDAGGYTVYATAFDGAGNKTTSAARSFSIVGTASAADAVSVADKSAGRS